SQMLDYLGYNHVLAGYVIQIPGHQFLVEEACSGVQTVFALLATAAVLAVWLRRPLVHGALLVASAVFWAIAVNVIRVTLVVVLYVERGVDVGNGWPQTMFGIGLFVLVLLFLLSTDRLLLFLLGPLGLVKEDAPLRGPDGPDPSAVREQTDAAIPGTNGMSLVMLNFVALAFLSIGVVQTATGVNRRLARNDGISFADDDRRGDRVPLSDVLSEATLPERLGALERVEFKVETRSPNSDRGRYSIAWHYKGSQEDAIVSLDFPFVGWHNLAGCYQARGWQVESWTVVEQDTVEETLGAPCAELQMKDASARRGHVWVRQFTGEGHALAPPSTPGRSLSAWCAAARDRVFNRFGKMVEEPSTLQIQMLITSDLPLDDEHHQRAMRAFQDAVRQITKQLWPEGKIQSD
ncbi:MAG: exosortase U, partial [Planctomycetes bacterium]|nr:exosortase U [Planctomycetota bacterium]